MTEDKRKVEMGLDDIPRSVRLPPEEEYVMISLMELEQIGRGTSPFKEIAIFMLSVFISTLPGAWPFLEAVVNRASSFNAQAAIYCFVTICSGMIGAFCTFVWAYEARRRKTLMRRILERSKTRLTARTALDYPAR